MKNIIILAFLLFATLLTAQREIILIGDGVILRTVSIQGNITTTTDRQTTIEEAEQLLNRDIAQSYNRIATLSAEVIAENNKIAAAKKAIEKINQTPYISYAAERFDSILIDQVYRIEFEGKVVSVEIKRNGGNALGAFLKNGTKVADLYVLTARAIDIVPTSAGASQGLTRSTLYQKGSCCYATLEGRILIKKI